MPTGLGEYCDQGCSQPHTLTPSAKREAIRIMTEENRGALGIDVAVSIPATRVTTFLTQVIDLVDPPPSAVITAPNSPVRPSPIVQRTEDTTSFHPARQARPERLH